MRLVAGRARGKAERLPPVRLEMGKRRKHSDINKILEMARLFGVSTD